MFFIDDEIVILVVNKELKETRYANLPNRDNYFREWHNYQTLIANIVHGFVSGNLVEKSQSLYS
ncbi:MAG: hypothetical protein QG641_184 [Candidatus Poribacteria bacterium]|nr:hypothetical protein [Candidatus Poribacteria bacterium]